MRPESLLIGLVVFSVFLVGGILLWGNVIDTYDLNTTTSAEGANFSGVYDIIDNTYDLSQSMKEHTLGGDIEGGEESWESMAKGSYSAIKAPFTMASNGFNLFGQIIHSIAGEVGIPPFFINAAIIILTISILFSIIYMIFRFKG